MRAFEPSSIRRVAALHRGLLAGVVTALLLAAATACVPGAGGTVSARGGVGQILATGQPPGVSLEVVDAGGQVVPSVDLAGNTVLARTTDASGQVVFRYLPPGEGYQVRRADTKPGVVNPSGPVAVTAMDQAPSSDLYTNQHLTFSGFFNNPTTGYGYMTTRDGTQLSYTVRLPGPVENGPYPTVIEYSGYDPANPTAQQPSEHIANLLGFATVGVNMRGTGCSGGSFQFFEQSQSTDGYDVVETVATQPWVLNHKVGMVGISYPGISQLFVGQTQPPSLAALAPLSVLDDSYQSTLYPGGIFNDGFALSWVTDRVNQGKSALPVPAGETRGGQAWAQSRIDAGDKTCAANQALRTQNPDMLGIIERNPFFPTEYDLGNSLAPRTFVGKINVPVFLAGAWQDDQTGGHFPNMLDKFASAPVKKFTLVNGNHTESLTPQVLSRWLEFLQFYVARKVPDGSTLRNLGPLIEQQVLGSPGPVPVPFPPDRFTGMTYAAALAQYQAEPSVRILFDQGGAPGYAAGLPQPGFEASFNQWPLPAGTISPTRYYLGSGGALSTAAPTAADGAAGTVDSYTSDPSARPRYDFSGDTSGTWAQLPAWNWTPVANGKALSYLSAPLASNTVMAGNASVDLWLKSTAADTDLQVTISEVRPDGGETYVQNGWLRASHRALDPTRSTELRPAHTDLRSDAADLPVGQFTPVRVELFPFAHAFRAGSQLRITVEAPGGDRPFWGFDTLPGTPTNSVARSVGMPSSVVLPVVPSVAIPAPLPPCPALRGQPCRAYVPITNAPS